MASTSTEEAPAIGIRIGTENLTVGFRKKSTENLTAGKKSVQGALLPASARRNREWFKFEKAPAYVAFTTRRKLFGEEAKRQADSNPKNTIFDLSTLIGRRFSDPSIQDGVKKWPFRVVASPNDKPTIVVKYKGQDKNYFAEDLLCMLLKEMKGRAETYLGSGSGSSSVKDAVVTAPAFFNDTQRIATKEACKRAGLNVLDLMYEPSAAVVAYAFEEGWSLFNDKKNVLVFYLRRSTCYISLLEVKNGIINLKSAVCDNHLGGDDFTTRMMDYCVEDFMRRYEKDITGVSRSMGKLKKACEKAKKELSSAAMGEVIVKDLHGIDFSCSINQALFEELNSDLFTKCMDLTEKCLSCAKVNKDSVDFIIPVGGSTRIPSIQMLLCNLIYGLKLRKIMDPRDIVACGATIQAARMSNQHIVEIYDYMYMHMRAILMLQETESLLAIEKEKCKTEALQQDAETITEFLNNKLQETESLLAIEKEKNTTKENELSKIKKEALEASQEHAKTKKELLDKLQGKESSLATEKEKNTKKEDELNSIKRKAQEASQQHENTKKELLDKLQETESLLAIEKEKNTKNEEELSKIKREVLEASHRHENTKNELLDKLQGTEILLAKEKEESTKKEEELSKIKRKARDESQQHEKTKNELTVARVELERQKKLLSEESWRHQQAEIDLQHNFVELNKTKSLLQARTKEHQEIQKLYDEMFIQNERLKIRQNTIAKDFEKFRQWNEEQASNNHYITNFTEFSYAELKEGTSDFNNKLKIGSGGYGTVYKGVLHCTNVAIKVLNKGSEDGEREFNQEVETVRALRHPNLAKLIGSCHENWTLVYEFLPKGSLEDCFRNAEGRKSLSWETRIQVASNICSALVFLHQTKPHAIVHGDLKPANILLDSSYSCKLIDFGTCRQLKITETTKIPHHKTEEPRGTWCYFDPEYLDTRKITIHSDVFAFGVVLLQLVTGKEPTGVRRLVQDALESRKLNEVADPFANWPLEVAEKMARLGLCCVDWFRQNRPDLEEVRIEIESMEQIASRS